MTDTKHTPTPWGISGNLLVSGDRHVQNNRVGATFNYRGNAKANAAFIVRAVNAHEALVAALAEVMEWIANWHPDFTDDPEWSDTRQKVDAALSLARSE